MNADDRAILVVLRAARYATEAHLVAMCASPQGYSEAKVRRALERFRSQGLIGWGPTLGYWLMGKGEEAATGHFAVTVLKASR